MFGPSIETVASCADSNVVGEAQLSRMICSETNDDHLVHRTRKHLARESDWTIFVRDARDSGVQIELTPVVGGTFVSESDSKKANRLVRHLLDWLRHHFSANQFVRFSITACEDQAPDFGQRFQCFWIVRIVRATGVQRVFVQLEQLKRRITEDHCAQTSIPNRQRICPLARRFVVPQNERLLVGTRKGTRREYSQPQAPRLIKTSDALSFASVQ